ncbi:Uncharacterized protein family UPF0564 [Plasmodiophora brassicae]
MAVLTLNLNHLRVRAVTPPPTCDAPDPGAATAPLLHLEAFRSTTRVLRQQSRPSSPKVATPTRRPSSARQAAVRRVLDELQNPDRHQDDGPAPHDEFLRVLRRMKARHERNLAMVEAAYYSDNNNEGAVKAAEETAAAVVADEPKRAIEWTGEPTVPKPFTFSDRDPAAAASSITRRRRQAYLDEVAQRDDVEMRKTFRAAPIPRSTLEPRLVASEARRQARLEQQRAAASSTASLHDRPRASSTRRPASAEPAARRPAPFRARPVPWSVKVAMFAEMRAADDAARQRRIAERAARTLAAAALPTRMAVYERTIGAKKRLLREHHRATRAVVVCGGSSSRAQAVPDFGRLHAAFAGRLQRARTTQQRPATAPADFRFMAEPRRRRVAAAADNDTNVVVDQQRRRRRRFKATLSTPALTLKYLGGKARVAARLRERDEEAARRDEALRVDAERQAAWRERIRPLLVDNRQQLEAKKREALRAARQHDREAMREAARRLKEMRERVDRRPLLLESGATNRERILARQKALVAVKDSLLAAGIRDYRRFFDEDELDDLEMTDL